MKRIISLAVGLAACASTVFAGSLDYLSNQSASFFFNTSRTAATDGADAASYNPAGTALLGKGFFIDVSSQTFLKNYEESLASTDYEQTEPTLCLPNLYLVYNLGKVGPGKLAFFSQLGVSAGGGAVNWEDGTVGTTVGVGQYQTALAGYLSTTATGLSTSLEASSVYYAASLGSSYAFLEDRLAVSAGVRYNYASRSGKVNTTMDFSSYSVDFVYDYDYTAQGFTGIFGLDARPIQGLTLGVRYEMETPMEFEYSTNKFNATASNGSAVVEGTAETVLAGLNADGTKSQQNLPQLLSLGAEYVLTQKWTVATSANIYFLGSADMDGAEDFYGTGYDANVSVKFRPIEKLALGATFMYTDMATEDDLWESTAQMMGVSGNPPLNCITCGLGAQYTVLENLDVLLSGAYSYYPEQEATLATYDVSYSKKIIDLCIGAKYKF